MLYKLLQKLKQHKQNTPTETYQYANKSETIKISKQ